MSNDERRLLTESILVAPNKPKKSIFIAFFGVGSGAVVTYNAVVMAVAYFRLDGGLGAGALTQFARWHNIMLVSCMCLIFFSPRKPSIRTHVTVLIASFIFGLSFNVSLLIVASTRSSIAAEMLYALVAINGCATGAACSLGASLSGLFDTYSLSHGTGVAQLRGAAFGIALPTAVQLAMLPVAVTKTKHLEWQTALAAALSAAAASVLCAGAIVSTVHIAADKTCRDCAISERGLTSPCEVDAQLVRRLRSFNPERDTIGTCVACGQRDFVRERFNMVGPLVLAQFINNFCLIKMLLLSPSLPIVGKGRPFWLVYMPTLAIASNNIFGYLGRSISRPPPEPTAIWPAAYVASTPIGLAALHIYKALGGHVGLPASNALPIVFYSAIAVLSGRTTVVVSQKAQQACGHSHEWTCPIVAQVHPPNRNTRKSIAPTDELHSH